MAAFRQRDRCAGRACGTQSHTGQRDGISIELVVDGYRAAGDRLSACRHGNRKSLRASVQRTGSQCRCRVYAWDYRQRGYRKRDTQSCNQLKPQSAADYASHVYFAPNLKKNRLPPVCRSPNLIVSGGSGPEPFPCLSLDAIQGEWCSFGGWGFYNKAR
jgi:hypothetical protein